MIRLQLSAALALALALAADVFCFPLPRPPVKAPTPPLPEGAVRRFGSAPTAPPKVEEPPTMMRNRRRFGEAPEGLRTVMALTSDGKSLVVADYTGRIDIWDVATGKLIKRLQEPGKEQTHSVGVSPDGRWLACGRTRPDIQIWDLSAGKAVQTIPLSSGGADRSSPGYAERLVFSPDNKVLFSSVEIFSESTNRGVTAWEVSSGKRLWNVDGVGYNLAVDPRGRWVLTGLLQESPSRLALLDAATGKVAVAMPIEPSWEMSDAGAVTVDASGTMDRLVTPDGSRLISTHDDGTVRVWDPARGREVKQIKWGPAGISEPGGLACSPDGKWVAVRNQQTIMVWEVASGRQVYTINGHDGPVREMVFTRDGRGLVSNAGPAPILWSLKPKELPAVTGPADAMWEALGSDDATAAYRLQWALIDSPKAAIPFFSARVHPKDMVLPRARFDRLVATLDSPEYAARERAERDLTVAAMTVPTAWLRTALTAAPSEEVQARLRRVLTRRETAGPAGWRLERAVQVLELAGTPEATALLAEWAAGPADSALTDAAGGAMKRIGAAKRSVGAKGQ